MAKGKGAAGSAVANRPAYCRVSFLYQAAALFATTPTATTTVPEPHRNETAPADSPQPPSPAPSSPPLQGIARRLLTQMRAVARKTNMRVRPAVKHRVCKYCDTLLVNGSTCVSVVENRSRGGRKPWADVLVVTCNTCGHARRYPISAPRQPRRPFRNDGTAAGARDAVRQDELAEKIKGSERATAQKGKKGKQASGSATAPVQAAHQGGGALGREKIAKNMETATPSAAAEGPT